MDEIIFDQALKDWGCLEEQGYPINNIIEHLNFEPMVYRTNEAEKEAIAEFISNQYIIQKDQIFTHENVPHYWSDGIISTDLIVIGEKAIHVEWKVGLNGHCHVLPIKATRINF